MGALEGRVALITGAARGQGRAHALALAAEGADIVAADAPGPMLDLTYPLGTEDDLRDTAKRVEELGQRCLAIALDVRDSAQVGVAVEQTLKEMGSLDIVVANAGIGIYGSVLKVDPWLSKPSSMSIWSVSSIPCARLCHRSSSGAATCSSCRRLRLISPARAWRHTTPPRRATSTSQARFVRRSLISASTSAQKCADVFVKGIEGRKRRVNCPGWVGVFRWLKPLLTTSAGESQLAKTVPELLPRMDAEIAALGRSMSARTEALEKRTTR